MNSTSVADGSSLAGYDKSAGCTTVGNDTIGRRTGADPLAIDALRISALKDESVCRAFKQALEREEDSGGQRPRLVVQRPAVRCVESLDVLALAAKSAPREPGIGAALGAVAMQHVEVEPAGVRGHLVRSLIVADAGLAAHGQAR